MTTKPKANKYRTRRQSQRQHQAASSGDEPAAKVDVPDQPNAEQTADQQLSAIRAEGLTGRQLRMARRVAQRHGLTPASDYDAVRLLRVKGIDPFKRASMLELVVTNAGQRDANGEAQPGNIQLPSTEVRAEDIRAREILRIQQDIARRRRKKLALLMVRLAFFVFLPTAVAGYYYYSVATPLYATKSEFVIQQAQSPAAGGAGLGGLFAGTQFATSQDSITVQSYLQSRDAMLRLDREHGFRDHFSQPHIDSLQRLPDDASNEDTYSVYSDLVSIAYDPTEGIIKMEVSAAEPETSARFSRALITYAEDIVDNLSQRLREDQMKGARESFAEAEQKMREAQLRVIELQEQYNVISTDIEVSLLTNRIATLEGQMTQDQLNLEEILSNPQPNPARVDPLKRRIDSLQATIARLRSQLTEGRSGDVSLARIGSELQVAQADLETRNLMMQESLQQMESARVEANRQTRYLSTGVTPVPPDEPTYPRSFENTVLAFLIFSGIYLMASLTASILREQVSS